MSRDEGFLSRWSKRKSEAARAPERAPAPPAVETPAPEETVDLSLLPSIDSLTAETDITAFLKKGVPEVLKTAALRKMWATDPAIRDYIGPADYQWDFNTPGALDGFGELATGTDIEKMIADLSDYHLRPAEPVPDVPVETVVAEASPELEPASGDSEEKPDEESPVEPLPAPPVRRRRHGGAMPA